MMLLKSSYYLRLLNVLASLYPLQTDIQRVALAMGVAPEKLIITGTGKDLWDSLLSCLDWGQAQAGLVAFVLKEYPDNLPLRVMQPSLEDGSAYIDEVDPKPTSAKSQVRKAIRIISLYDDSDDREFVLPMLNHLRSLKISYPNIELDSMPAIRGGVSVKDARIKQLAKASIVLLFITGRFFENVENQCWPLTVDAIRLGRKVIPLLMEACPWSRIRIVEGIQALPGNGVFISQWEDRKEGFARIAGELERFVQLIQ